MEKKGNFAQALESTQNSCYSLDSNKNSYEVYLMQLETNQAI